jgi:DNA-binding SARP family transcriptional activator
VLPGSDPNGGVIDGLVAADYYFVVPITNRRGILIISSTRTTGVEYRSFEGSAPLELNIGGPTSIPLNFPKRLSVTIPVLKKSSTTTPETASSIVLNIFALMLAALIAGVVLLARRREHRSRRPVPAFVIRNAPAPKPPNEVFREHPAEPTLVVSHTKTIAANETTLRVNVLGPLTISPVNSPASDPVRAIVAFLAINAERPFTLDEIQTAVWPLTDTGTDIKKPAMRNYMVDVRKVVSARHLPSASGRAGYQLKDFTTDWSEFQALLSQAAKLSPEEAAKLRHRALDLTRGPPFEADTRRYFTWTFTLSVVYKMIKEVTTLAHELARDLVLTGDLVGSEAVLRQGLLVDPVSLTLWEDLTDVLLESTDQSFMDLHWKAASHVLRSEDVGLLRNRVNG